MIACVCVLLLCGSVQIGPPCVRLCFAPRRRRDGRKYIIWWRKWVVVSFRWGS